MFHVQGVYTQDLEKGKQLGQVVQLQSKHRKENILDSNPTDTEDKKIPGHTNFVFCMRKIATEFQQLLKSKNYMRLVWGRKKLFLIPA